MIIGQAFSTRISADSYQDTAHGLQHHHAELGARHAFRGAARIRETFSKA
jgi:hypothetical protein